MGRALLGLAEYQDEKSRSLYLDKAFADSHIPSMTGSRNLSDTQESYQPNLFE